MQISNSQIDSMYTFFDNVKKLWNQEYMSDVTKIFDLYDDVYMDICHVTEKGNSIIAEVMYEFLLKKGCFYHVPD